MLIIICIYEINCFIFDSSKQNKMKEMKSIAELNQIICDYMGVKIEDYNKMSFSEKHKLGNKYMKLKFGLKTRNK